MIFALPPGEVAVHPGSGWGRGPGHHALFLMCHDIEHTVAELERKGVEFVVSDRGRGLGPDRALQDPRRRRDRFVRTQAPKPTPRVRVAAGALADDVRDREPATRRRTVAVPNVAQLVDNTTEPRGVPARVRVSPWVGDCRFRRGRKRLASPAPHDRNGRKAGAGRHPPHGRVSGIFPRRPPTRRPRPRGRPARQLLLRVPSARRRSRDAALRAGARRRGGHIRGPLLRGPDELQDFLRAYVQGSTTYSWTWDLVEVSTAGTVAARPSRKEP